VNLVDRFTRDRVSRTVWGSCLMIAIGLLGLAVELGRRTSDDEWFRLQVISGALVLVLLALTILSFRKPVARIGAGVGFLAEAVPPAVIEQERLRAVNEVYDEAQERVVRLKERLRQAEEARLAAEGELQKVLSSKPVTESNVPTEVVSAESVASSEQVADPYPIVLPEPEVAGSTEAVTASTIPDVVELRDADEEDAEIARDLLLRMIDTEVPMAEIGVDPGEVRARLARTAARKKPGGGERRIVEDEPVQEMPPWARNR
jgi:hypothetical protein